jgi:hypothetical protein
LIANVYKRQKSTNPNRMSLFNGVTEGAARKPDTVINGSGRFLDIQGSAIRGISGKINQGSSFFDSVTPYGPLSVSDDINYRTRPIKCQKVCPEIMLPAVDGSHVKLSHAVASGDLCFTIRLSKSGKNQVIRNYNFFDKINLTPALDCLVGLPCVNYLLAGLCHYTVGRDLAEPWVRFLGSVIGSYDRAEKLMTKLDDPVLEAMRKSKLMLLLVKEYIKPFGFCIGSDWQGGQTQGSAEPNIGPVSYVTVAQIEGLAENIVNIWAKAGNTVNCGDDLSLALVPHRVKKDRTNSYKTRFTKEFDNVLRPMGSRENYVLNHWQYNTVKQTMNFDEDEVIYELLPISSSTIQKGAFPGWHICRTQLMAKAHTPALTCYRDDILMQKTGALLEVTIAPVFEYAYITEILYLLLKTDFQKYVKLYKSEDVMRSKLRKEPSKTLNEMIEQDGRDRRKSPAATGATDPTSVEKSDEARKVIFASPLDAPTGEQNDTFQMDSIFAKPAKRQKKQRAVEADGLVEV